MFRGGGASAVIKIYLLQSVAHESERIELCLKIYIQRNPVNTDTEGTRKSFSIIWVTV